MVSNLPSNPSECVLGGGHMANSSADTKRTAVGGRLMVDIMTPKCKVVDVAQILTNTMAPFGTRIW